MEVLKMMRRRWRFIIICWNWCLGSWRQMKGLGWCKFWFYFMVPPWLPSNPNEENCSASTVEWDASSMLFIMVMIGENPIVCVLVAAGWYKPKWGPAGSNYKSVISIVRLKSNWLAGSSCPISFSGGHTYQQRGTDSCHINITILPQRLKHSSQRDNVSFARKFDRNLHELAKGGEQGCKSRWKLSRWESSRGWKMSLLTSTCKDVSWWKDF